MLHVSVGLKVFYSSLPLVFAYYGPVRLTVPGIARSMGSLLNHSGLTSGLKNLHGGSTMDSRKHIIVDPQNCIKMIKTVTPETVKVRRIRVESMRV